MIEWIQRKMGRMKPRDRDAEKEIEMTRRLHREVLKERLRVLDEFHRIEQSLR